MKGRCLDEILLRRPTKIQMNPAVKPNAVKTESDSHNSERWWPQQDGTSTNGLTNA